MKNKQDGVGTQTHYTAHGIEPIDYIVANVMNFLEGNVIKYVTRYKLKNGLEDLEKAQQYLTWLIDEVKATEKTDKPWVGFDIGIDDSTVLRDVATGEVFQCNKTESMDSCIKRFNAAEVKNAIGQHLANIANINPHHKRRETD